MIEDNNRNINSRVDKRVTIRQTEAFSLVIMIAQDGKTYIMSHTDPSARLADTNWCALNRIKTKSNKEKEKKSSKKPGMDFLCPPVLVDMLGRHWRDLQDGFSDPAGLNQILVFQSDELRWTAQKRGESELDEEKVDDDHNNNFIIICISSRKMCVHGYGYV